MQRVITFVMVSICMTLFSVTQAAPPPQLGPHPEIQNKPRITKDQLQKVMLIKAHINKGHVSPQVVPFANWCASHPNGQAQSRVWVETDAPSIPSGASIPARLVSNLGATNHVHNFNLTKGVHSVGTSTFNIPAREICSDRCIYVHLEARNASDAPKVSSVRKSICVRE